MEAAIVFRLFAGMMAALMAVIIFRLLRVKHMPSVSAHPFHNFRPLYPQIREFSSHLIGSLQSIQVFSLRSRGW